MVRVSLCHREENAIQAQSHIDRNCEKNVRENEYISLLKENCVLTASLLLNWHITMFIHSTKYNAHSAVGDTAQENENRSQLLRSSRCWNGTNDVFSMSQINITHVEYTWIKRREHIEIRQIVLFR